MSLKSGAASNGAARYSLGRSRLEASSRSIRPETVKCPFHTPGAHDPEVERERVRRRSMKRRRRRRQRGRGAARRRTQKTRLEAGLEEDAAGCSATRRSRAIRRGMGAIFWLGRDEFAPVRRSVLALKLSALTCRPV